MIPKIIHYCWFGNNKKPALFERCIKSWKKFCPDYKIKEWNEDNFDIHICPYIEEAYNAEKWAFVTDYARLFIIYTEGGIYLDTDVEIVKSFDDLLSNEAFFGFENVGLGVNESYIATGLGFGAESMNAVIRQMIHEYDNQHFVDINGNYDLTTCPIRNMRALEKLLPQNYSPRKVIKLDHATLYPAEYFCPLDAMGVKMKKTENTHSIHWYNASWLTVDQQVVHKYRVFQGKCKYIFGDKIGSYIAKIVYLFRLREREVLKRM